MDEVSITDQEQRAVRHVRRDGRTVCDTSGVLAATWLERRGMELGKPSLTSLSPTCQLGAESEEPSYKETKGKGVSRPARRQAGWRMRP